MPSERVNRKFVQRRAKEINDENLMALASYDKLGETGLKTASGEVFSGAAMRRAICGEQEHRRSEGAILMLHAIENFLPTLRGAKWMPLPAVRVLIGVSLYLWRNQTVCTGQIQRDGAPVFTNI